MIMIKNNLKLMLRCKVIILVVLLMVVVTGLLSSVFKEMMTDNFEIKNCTAGFSFSQDCKFEPAEDLIKTLLNESGFKTVYCEDVTEGKQKNKGAVDVFIEITDAGCTVYSDENYANESSIARMIVYSVISNTSGTQTKDYTKQYEIKVDPTPDSQLYYTIAYIVYFTWCASIILGVVISSERKNKIGLKFKSSPISSFRIYLSRFVPLSIVITLLIGISAAVCTPLYSINWKTPILSFFIIFLSCIASAAIGTVIFSLVKNVIVSIALLYSLFMYWGFFGGAFASYLIASYADGLRETSPIYFMIRSLAELNTMGHSDYVCTTILILSAITVVCIPLGIIAVKLRRE